MGLESIESGTVFFDGKDLVRMDAANWRSMRREVQMLFADPLSSFNPRHTIGESIIESMLVHHIVSRKEAGKEAERLMDLVHLPVEALQLHPHQFDQAQLQRIGIARAIALRPKLLICDDALSTLDLSKQAEILNLLKELQTALRLSILFISNDLAAIHYISDRVLVMQTGKIVERGTAEDILNRPKEPHTKKLVEAML
jgi:ABC-type glutathione transport system ATPase component